MKLRRPGTLSAAINEIKMKLTESKCAEIVERSVSLIRKWADPDDPAMPNLRQSLLLDVEYVRAGFGEAPIQNWYLDRLEGFVEDNPQSTSDLVASTLHAQSALGQVALAVAQFTVDGSEHGADLSPNERAVVLGMVEKLSLELDKLEGSLQDNLDWSSPISLRQFRAK